MKITDLDDFKKRKRDEEFNHSPELMQWFKHLDKYKEDRALEILNQYNSGELSVSDLIWDIVTRETGLIDLGNHALKLSDEKYNPDKVEYFLMGIFSESVGAIDTTTKAYQKHIEKESD